ncbi:MAG: glutathione S-transferase family protein [Alphaproteobacteria bacterium]|nr:glutathione S-transferase family protein [Alphaproteobacteria bacterium]
MLNLCGADWVPRHVDYFNGETRTPAYRSNVNEMGEAPVLEFHEGSGLTRLSQSGVILDYLSRTFGRFGPETETERRETLRWLFFDNHKLTSYTGTYRFLVRFMKAGDTPVTEFLRTRITGAYDVLNTHLARQRFAVGERPTIADISMCGYLYFADEFGIDWADYPNIGRWLDDIRALPGWVHPYELMPGHPLPEKT